MIVDSSVIVAIVMREAEEAAFLAALALARRRAMSAASWLEAGMVADRKGDGTAGARMDGLLGDMAIDIVPFTKAHAGLAREAWRRFGKGSGHPAQLNFGDCMAYALARERGEPLLFKGDDFARTDIEPALAG